jgi:hypothetical protein
MSPRLLSTPLLLIAFCSTSTTFAEQNQAEQPTATQETEQPMSMMGSASPEMQEMARAMKSMADMCQMMMQREMQMRPYIMEAGGVIGTTLFIALVLFVVLETQWIRFWSLRIKTEREKLK